jgi:hypothetical protein
MEKHRRGTDFLCDTALFSLIARLGNLVMEKLSIVLQCSNVLVSFLVVDGGPVSRKTIYYLAMQYFYLAMSTDDIAFRRGLVLYVLSSIELEEVPMRSRPTMAKVKDANPIPIYHSGSFSYFVHEIANCLE